jgi:hypothetical protein
MRFVLFPVLLALLIVPAAVHATTVRYLDLEGLVRSSSMVFHATVLEVTQKNLGTPEKLRLVTDVSFQVHRVLQGTNPGPRFDLRLGGGTANGHTLAIPGQPCFKEGEEVVLFLEFTGQELVVNGMSQGVFRIQRDPAGLPTAHRDTTGLSVLGREGGNGPLEPGKPEQPLPLDDLFRRIHDLQAR